MTVRRHWVSRAVKKSAKRQPAVSKQQWLGGIPCRECSSTATVPRRAPPRRACARSLHAAAALRVWPPPALLPLLSPHSAGIPAQSWPVTRRASNVWPPRRGLLAQLRPTAYTNVWSSGSTLAVEAAACAVRHVQQQAVTPTAHGVHQSRALHPPCTTCCSDRCYACAEAQHASRVL